MQVLCERFLRFMAGEDEDPGSDGLEDLSGGRPGIADQVGDSDAAIAVPEQMQPRNLGDHRLQPLYPF